MLFASSLFYSLVVCLLLELAYNDLRPVKTPPFSGLQTVTMMVVAFVGEDEDDDGDAFANYEAVEKTKHSEKRRLSQGQ